MSDQDEEFLSESELKNLSKWFEKSEERIDGENVDIEKVKQMMDNLFEEDEDFNSPIKQQTIVQIPTGRDEAHQPHQVNQTKEAPGKLHPASITPDLVERREVVFQLKCCDQRFTLFE